MAKSILLVDDDSGIRNKLKATLTQEGFRVLTALNGREAIFTAREEVPDLIILDLMMPEMSGFEFMRVYGRDSSKLVIMLTAKVAEADKVLGLELGRMIM
jgi:two-component system alkaline phosphatase synthesis response regulator PhoP